MGYKFFTSGLVAIVALCLSGCGSMNFAPGKAYFVHDPLEKSLGVPAKHR